MPYDQSNPPKKLKSLSPKRRRQWVRVFNSCWDRGYDEARCHRMAWGAVKSMSEDKTDVLKQLASFSSSVSKEDSIDESETEAIASDIQESAENAASAVEEAIDDEKKIPVDTSSGAKGMARALSRIFGGWNGGCRLIPSATRLDTHHLAVFSSTPTEMGKRMLRLRNHLLSNGFRESTEGVFSNDHGTVYQGRTYTRRGGRPIAFMVTVETK
jgi:uncharacterized protein YdaT